MKPTVLIIDDELHFVDSLKDLLSKEFRIIFAETGRAGLEILKDEEVDIVLLDYRLPDTNGIEVLKEIRSSYSSVTVFMISGHGSKNVVLSAWNERADFYLDKPLEVEVLRNKLHLHFVFNRKNHIKKFVPSTMHQTIEKIIDIVNKNPFRFRTVRDVADSIQLNPDYLSTMFKKETGIYLHNYLVASKIEEAMELLSSSISDIKEISYSLGFTSQHSFYKAFKKITGLSPSEYRKSAKGGCNLAK